MATGAHNVCGALARRELTGRRANQPNLPRRTVSLRQVFRQEEGGVLLGFSSDGNFLIYCIDLDSHYEVQWRRVNFQDFYQWREAGEAPEITFALRVEGGSSAYGVSTPLEVWQSVDCNLVLAVTMDQLAQDRESSRLCRVVVAPSPVFDEGRAAVVESLGFELNQHALSQKLEKWQLLQLAREQKGIYHLLVNAGTVVHVLVLHVRRIQHGQEEDTFESENKPRGLGISHFAQNAWYYSPVFPVKFEKSIQQRRTLADPDSDFGVVAECVCQQIFDVERFLGEFLETFKPLRHFNLFDYDLRLVQASSIERIAFMICVIALTPSEPARPNARHLRVAVFLSLKLFTGTHHIIRVLKVPEKGDLRQLSQVVARRFLADLNARMPQEPAPATCDNEAFLREESLQELHNPLYPLIISNT